MNSIYKQTIIDTHIHFWDLKKFSYQWIKKNQNKKLNQNYLFKNFSYDSKSLNLKKAVHVQAEIDSFLKIEETKWLQLMASKNKRGIPNGIIGYVDLSSKNAEVDLEKHLINSNFRGIRQILKHNQQSGNEKNFLKDKIWIENLKLLEKHNLSFDLLIFYNQFNEASKVIDMYPNLQFIIKKEFYWKKQHI